MSIKALQEYTRISKYARFDPTKGRRETWDEQVDRVFEMHRQKLGEDICKSISKDLEFADEMIKRKRILGSQRALQFGGDPILKKNARMYNCTVSYCDRPRFFQECMYLLLCGCGTGFSVQKHHIAKLPPIAVPTKNEKIFSIPDSIEGWADAIGVLMSSYFQSENVPFPEFQGHKISFDFSKIRPEGSPLSSGGKAPGSNGLRASLLKINYLLEKTCKLSNRLHPIDAYDICMHASDAVLSGGIRRSATICIFSPDDIEMLNAKTGSWFIENPQRGRSNNSALLIREKTSKEIFDVMMKSVQEFGEPGFIWADDEDALYNPCVTMDGWIHTSNGPRQVSDLIGNQFNAIVNGESYDSTDKGFFKTGENRDIFKIISKEGFEVRATENHKFLVLNKNTSVWKELKDLSIGDEIVIHNHNDFKWDGEGTEMQGWLLGSLVGDGTFDDKSACLDYWGETSQEMNDIAVKFIKESNLETYHDIHGGNAVASVPKRRVYSVGVSRLAEEYGITKDSKEITELVEMASYDFYKGFIRGYFDADGSVNGNQEKGVSVRLWSVSKNNLQRIQRMLLRMGIYSKIYFNRIDAGNRLLPDGKGGEKEYFCQDGHELVISKSSVVEFYKRIGFSDRLKAVALEEMVSSYKREVSKSKFVATVLRMEPDGKEDVYDCTINTVHAFDINGYYAHNCVEIGFYAKLDLKHNDVKGRMKNDPEFADLIEKEKKVQSNEKELSGWSFCNLCEINMKKPKNEEEFLESCRAAAIVGTLQASYDHFDYLGPISDMIVKREALLGVSMTGMADNPDIAFDPKIQKKGAKLILEVNEQIAKAIGINKCARATCVKPAGTTSCILGTASGIHPHHAKRYFRRVQANKLETTLQYFSKFNPKAVEESVWSNHKTDMVITFLCEVPDGAKTKNQVDALTLLENVKLTQQNWVEYGTRVEESVKPWIRHNVSNTINVRPDEWAEVGNYLFRNRNWFAGVSMIPTSGDKDYPQAPFTAVFTPSEIVREYGDASIFASGLIVDGLRAFEDNLWKACDCVLGIGEIITVDALRAKIKRDSITNGVQWKAEGLNGESPDKLLQAWLEHNVKNYVDKTDWVRRAKQFATRYFDGNDRLMTYCLKDVANWKTWCDLKREYVEVDWAQCYEDGEGHLGDEMQAGAACSGGACEIGELGLAIKASVGEKLHS